jgi:hypothetical protein
VLRDAEDRTRRCAGSRQLTRASCPRSRSSCAPRVPRRGGRRSAASAELSAPVVLDSGFDETAEGRARRRQVGREFRDASTSSSVVSNEHIQRTRLRGVPVVEPERLAQLVGDAVGQCREDAVRLRRLAETDARDRSVAKAGFDPRVVGPPSRWRGGRSAGTGRRPAVRSAEPR